MNLTHRNNRVKRKARTLKAWVIVGSTGTIYRETINESYRTVFSKLGPNERVARIKIEECFT